MTIKINKKIGSNTVLFEIEEEDMKKVLGIVSLLTATDYCGLCKKTNIIYDHNVAQTDDGAYLYIKRKCISCSATSTLGEYKQKMGYFWKKWEIYKKQEETQEDRPENAVDPNEDINLNEIPF